jgi:hypothetical protein
MELLFDNCRGFICSILDYENVLKIYKSRSHIHGTLRTIKSDELFEKYLTEVLLGNVENCYVLGAENVTTKELVSYSIVSFPKTSPFGFIISAGTIPPSSALTNRAHAGGISLLRLGVLLGKEKGYFDIFCSVKLSSYLPLCKMFNASEKLTTNISYWMMHKVVYPNDQLVTPIEKVLLGHNVLKRKYPIAIIQMSIKEEFRIEYYKKHFTVSEETIKKCTVPNYACSTSTITSLATNS